MNITNSSAKIRMPLDFQKLHIIMGILQITEATGMAIANLLIIMSYCMMGKRRNKIQNILLLAQSITDFYNCGTVWYEVGVNVTAPHQIQWLRIFLLLNNGLLEYSLTLSLCTLVVCSIERYLAIVKPMFHKRHVTKRRVVYSIVAMWVVSFIPVLILLFLMNFSVRNQNLEQVVLYSYVFDAIMFLIIIVVIVLLLVTLSKAKSSCELREQHYKNIVRPEKIAIKKKMYKKRVRLTLLFLVMLITYIATFIPLIIGRILFDTNIIDALSLYDKIVLLGVCQLLYKSSALVNPCFTLIIKDDYRRIVSGLFKSRALKKYVSTLIKIPADSSKENKMSTKLSIYSYEDICERLSILTSLKVTTL